MLVGGNEKFGYGERGGVVVEGLKGLVSSEGVECGRWLDGA